MSRRYGRNQRRQHREMIADGIWALRRMTILYNEQKALHDHTKAQLLTLQSRVALWDDEVRHILGRHTALSINPAKESFQSPPQRLPVKGRPLSSMLLSADITTDSLSYSIENMLYTLVRFDEDRQRDLRRLLRVQISGPEGYDRKASAGYAISEYMWEELMRDRRAGDDTGLKRFTAHVCEALSTHLVEGYKKRA